MALKSQIILYEPDSQEQAPSSVRDDQIRYFCESGRTPPISRTLEMYADVAAREAKFYAWGQRPELRGAVYVETSLELEDFLLAASAAASVLAAILVLFALRFSSVVSDRSAAAAVLLIAPAVFAYFLSRRSEHVLAIRFLRGLRWAIAFAAVWPLLAAGVLVAAGTPPIPGWVSTTIWVFAGLSLTNAAAMTGFYLAKRFLPT
jgi:hypothetical protein